MLISQGFKNCHSCHFRKICISCQHGKLTHSWCFDCLSRRLNIQADSIHSGSIIWSCPVCAQVCPCSKCKRNETSSEHATGRDKDVKGKKGTTAKSPMSVPKGKSKDKAREKTNKTKRKFEKEILPPVHSTKDAVHYLAAYILSTEKREAQAKINKCFDPETEDACFCCKDGGELLECDWNRDHCTIHPGCPKVYHQDCLGFAVPDDDQKWYCPRHYCANCGIKDPPFCCRLCPFSWCDACLPPLSKKIGPASCDLPGVTYIECFRCLPLKEQAEERNLLVDLGQLAGEDAVRKIFGDEDKSNAVRQTNHIPSKKPRTKR